MGADEWIAGQSVLSLLSKALRSLDHANIRIVLTVWDNRSAETYHDAADLFDQVIQFPSGASGRALTRCLADEGVDCFFSLPIESALGIALPRITWIYDFQHRHHPENFTPEERGRRNRLFAEHARTADGVLVFSDAVKMDFVSLYPDWVNKLRVIRFVPHLPSEAFTSAACDIAGLYRLPEEFFLLPNQFQPHKNHRLVLEALGILASRNCRPHVVCTGHTRTRLFEQISVDSRNMGLDTQWHCLGSVPRHHYFELLRKSVALLNPSLFEGFGLSVAEAKYLGKRVLVSDLPVLREHQHPAAIFFDPHDPEALAGQMAVIRDRAAPGPDLSLEASVRKVYTTQKREFGNRLVTLFREAIDA